MRGRPRTIFQRRRSRRSGSGEIHALKSPGGLGWTIKKKDDIESECQLATEALRIRYRLDLYSPSESIYGRAAYTAGFGKCEAAVVAQLQDLLQKRLNVREDEGDEGRRLFDATHNARLIASAERYYRAMYRGSAESWNMRDTHRPKWAACAMNSVSCVVNASATPPR
jgi:hypothetical protein